MAGPRRDRAARRRRCNRRGRHRPGRPPAAGNPGPGGLGGRGAEIVNLRGRLGRVSPDGMQRTSRSRSGSDRGPPGLGRTSTTKVSKSSRSWPTSRTPHRRPLLTSRTAVRFSPVLRENYTNVARALSYTLGDVDLGREATDEAMARAYALDRRSVRTTVRPAGSIGSVSTGRTRPGDACCARSRSSITRARPNRRSPTPRSPTRCGVST